MRLGSDGASVAVFDIEPDAAGRTAEAIERAGGRARAIVGDVGSEQDVATAVRIATETLGAVTIATTAAGVGVRGTVTDMSLDELDRALRVNLIGTCLAARYTIPHMVREGGGAFVAVSSISGVRGAAGWTPYCVSKHAVVGLVRCLALDYGPHGVRSNVVCPSFVDTPMTARMFEGRPEARHRREERATLGRFARVEEVAGVVSHLVSTEASYTNGSVYMVDGGESVGV